MNTKPYAGIVETPYGLIVYEETEDRLVRRELARLTVYTRDRSDTPPNERNHIFIREE